MRPLDPCPPVAYRGKMTANGYQPENHQWRDALCDRDADGRLVGKDPMAIPTAVLSASGHPYARVSAVIYRLRIMHGVATGEARGDSFLGLQPGDLPKRLTQIRERVCLPCSSGNKADIRRCHIYDCPAWPFRMGRNPHNPRRGINPFTPN